MKTGHSRVVGGAWILATTILASSMAFIDGTVVNVSMPAIQVTFHAGTNQLQWIVEAYALFLSALLLVGGSLGDVYGRRRIFAIGVVLFAVASTWCGLASSILLLIGARGLQGIGAALLIPGSLSLITSSFEGQERGRAIGTWSGFSAMTTAVGPILGGWLVDHASWRWVFFVNLPIAICVLALTFWRVPESRNTKNRGSLDWAGSVLITLALAALTIGLIERHSYANLTLYGSILALLAFSAFLFVEHRAQSPMLPLHLFRSRTFSVTNLVTLFLYTALAGMLFFLPLNLIQVQHYTASQSGAALLPLILTIFILSRWAGGLIGKYGTRLPLTIGPLIAAVGFALTTRTRLGGTYWETLFPAIFVVGLGLAVTVAPLTTAVMSAVPTSQSGVASGVNNAVSRVSGLLAVAIFGLVMLTAFKYDLNRRLGNSNLSQLKSSLLCGNIYCSLRSRHMTLAPTPR